MRTYEAPTLTEVGSVREITLGGGSFSFHLDEIYKWWSEGPFQEFS